MCSSRIGYTSFHYVALHPLGCTLTFPFCVVLCGSVVGGFKHFLFSPRGNDPILRSCYSEWVGSTTNYFSCCIDFLCFFFLVLHCHPSILGGFVLPRCFDSRNVWDIGGQKAIRPYWGNYFESTDVSWLQIVKNRATAGRKSPPAIFLQFFCWALKKIHTHCNNMSFFLEGIETKSWLCYVDYPRLIFFSYN